MRCQECTTENDEGAAFCATCGAPLTAYGGQVTGVVSAATRARAARLAMRPSAVAIMVAVDLLTLVFWPLRVAVGAVSGRTQLNAEGTNYMGAAFGALGTVMALVTMGIAAVLLLWLAWGTWSQRTWAWWANAAVLALAVLAGVLTLPAGVFWALLRIAVAGGLLYMWLRPEVREWYGASV